MFTEDMEEFKKKVGAGVLPTSSWQHANWPVVLIAIR